MDLGTHVNREGVGWGESTTWELTEVCTEQWADLPKEKDLAGYTQGDRRILEADEPF